jgi:hypothetical protein
MGTEHAAPDAANLTARKSCKGQRALCAIASVILVFIASIGTSAQPAAAVQAKIPTFGCTLHIHSGSVLVQPSGTEWLSGLEGQPVYPGWRVKTEEGSSAVLIFFEGSTLSLEPVTEVTVEELTHGPDGSTAIRVMQWLGTTWSQVVKIIDPASSYSVETPAACAAVRGTVFLVEVAPDGSTREETAEGLVVVEAVGQTVAVAPGFATSVEVGSAPAGPEKVAVPAEMRIVTNSKDSHRVNTVAKVFSREKNDDMKPEGIAVKESTVLKAKLDKTGELSAKDPPGQNPPEKAIVMPPVRKLDEKKESAGVGPSDHTEKEVKAAPAITEHKRSEVKKVAMQVSCHAPSRPSEASKKAHEVKKPS